jgi:hypothetical protein
MRKLVDTKFEYPFENNETPMQYGYHLMGKEELAKQNTYSISYSLGRVASFDAFMEGKFGKFDTMPERVKSFSYDLDAAISGTESSVVMVDIGGGKKGDVAGGEECLSNLPPDSLILQDHYAGNASVPGMKIVHRDYKSGTPQPVVGALNYSLAHIFHNLPDLDALELMQKIPDAMEPYSKLLIHGFSKNKNYGNMHATMVELFGGRERSSKEWKKLAAMARPRVTFEAYPDPDEDWSKCGSCDQESA